MIDARKLENLKVALVHDYLNQYGGAERVLECFAEMFPRAPIYTLLYDRKLMRGKFRDRVIKTSLLNNLLVRRHHRWFVPFFAEAAKFINLKDKYDLIISDSSGFGKGINYSKGFHISYIHSPLRYAWEPENYLETLLPRTLILLAKPVLSYLRNWDYKAGQKPNVILANSRYIAGKIEDYYERKAEVLYPPVDNKIFHMERELWSPLEMPSGFKNYFLAFGRLVHSKKFDLVIEAFTALGLPLLIIGAGPRKKKLENMIKSDNIKIWPDYIEDGAMRRIISGAEALIFPQVEDFGLAAAEAISCGTPVIAYAEGGAREIIEDGKTGVFFGEQTAESIAEAVKRFQQIKFDRMEIQRQARKFSKDNFKKGFLRVLERELIGD